MIEQATARCVLCRAALPPLAIDLFRYCDECIREIAAACRKTGAKESSEQSVVR